MRRHAPHTSSYGYHGPNAHDEPVQGQETESSTFQFNPDEFFGHGSTYGNYTYQTGFSENPNYEDAALYGPGFDDPMSSFHAFNKSKERPNLYFSPPF